MPLIDKEQFFEIWYPTTMWARSFNGPNDPDNRRNARESYNGSRQWEAAWQAYNRDQIAAENPSIVRTTPYTFNEPAPTFTQWSGPCYDNNCRNLRSQIEATERANYAAWESRKAQAESSEQRRIFEYSLLQKADIESQINDAKEAAAFLQTEQNKIQQDLVTEQNKISQQQQAEQENIQNQIAAARLATEQEMATIKAQFETERATNEKAVAEAAAETAKQQVITKKQVAVQQKAASSKNLSSLKLEESTPKPEVRKSKTMIGQPGVSVTRVSTRSGVGGYGGTNPARVNPTGLNI